MISSELLTSRTPSSSRVARLGYNPTFLSFLSRPLSSPSSSLPYSHTTPLPPFFDFFFLLSFLLSFLSSFLFWLSAPLLPSPNQLGGSPPSFLFSSSSLIFFHPSFLPFLFYFFFFFFLLIFVKTHYTCSLV